MSFFNTLQAYPALAVAFALLLGLLIGSFLNVVVYRLPKMMERQWQAECAEFIAENSLNAPLPNSVDNPLPASPLAGGGVSAPSPLEGEGQGGVTSERFNLLVPRSRCPHCAAVIKPWHNIPLLGYAMLRGRCAACKAGISPRYPLVELATGIISALVISYFGATWEGLAALVFSWCLISLTLIDLDTYLLPDSITLPLLWLGLLLNSGGLFTDLASAVWGAAAGYVSLWMVYQAFKLLTGKEGMGFGDFKLLAALGAWMGWQMLPQIILLSSLVGAVIGITLIIVRGRDRNIPIPFGPYLAIAGWIALLWGDTINTHYLQLLAAP